MNVELKYFGFYQGTLAGAFSLISLLSAKLSNWFGLRNCLYYSILLYIFSTLALGFITALNVQDPLIITGVVTIYSIAVVFPINILYPISLEVVVNSKARSAALINCVRLLSTAAMLQLISYVYAGNFIPLGIAMFFMSAFSLLFVWKIFQKGWAHIEVQEQISA